MPHQLTEINVTATLPGVPAAPHRVVRDLTDWCSSNGRMIPSCTITGRKLEVRALVAQPEAEQAFRKDIADFCKDWPVRPYITSEKIPVSEVEYYFLRLKETLERFDEVGISEARLSQLMLDRAPLSRFSGKTPQTVVDVGVWFCQFLSFLAERYPVLEDSLLLGLDSGAHFVELKDFVRVTAAELAADARVKGALSPRVFDWLKSGKAAAYRHYNYKNVYVLVSKRLAVGSSSRVFKNVFGDKRVDLVFLRRMLRYMDYAAISRDIAPQADALAVVDYNDLCARFGKRVVPPRDKLIGQFKGFKVDIKDYKTYFWLLAKRK